MQFLRSSVIVFSLNLARVLQKVNKKAVKKLMDKMKVIFKLHAFPKMENKIINDFI